MRVLSLVLIAAGHPSGSETVTPPSDGADNRRGIAPPCSRLTASGTFPHRDNRRNTIFAVVLVCAAAAALPVAAAAASKPQIQVRQLGHTLKVTFVAPQTTTREIRYFVRFQTARQEGCDWKSTIGGNLARAGQKVTINLGPRRASQGFSFCATPGTVTVFLQKHYLVSVAPDATRATFKLVGRVPYTPEG